MDWSIYNTQTYSLTLAAAAAPRATPESQQWCHRANPNDLIYVANNTEIDFRLGGTTTLYGAVVISLATTGNFDTAGSGVIYDNNRITGTGGIIKNRNRDARPDIDGQHLHGGINMSAGEVALPGGGSLGASPANGAAPQLIFSGNSTLLVTSTTGFGATRNVSIQPGVTATIDSDGINFAWGGAFVGSGTLVKLIPER